MIMEKKQKQKGWERISLSDAKESTFLSDIQPER